MRAIERGSRRDARDPQSRLLFPQSPEAISRDLLSLVDILTPNRLEALALAGMNSKNHSEPDWDVVADRLLDTGCRSVMITLGARWLPRRDRR